MKRARWPTAEGKNGDADRATARLAGEHGVPRS